ncbi:MAG TPA: hypothetical protein VHM19_08285 [Polyangiales bacterium]|nr:hypothetical protein [Polyangiales bacterium]
MPTPGAIDVPDAAGPLGSERANSGELAGSEAVGKAAPDSIAALARELEAGRLSAEQALDQLVERAAASLDGSLTAQERSELLSTLRSALASDPTLAALRDGLG